MQSFVSEIQNNVMTMQMGLYLIIVDDHVEFGMVCEVKIMYENIFVNPIIY